MHNDDCVVLGTHTLAAPLVRVGAGALTRVTSAACARAVSSQPTPVSLWEAPHDEVRSRLSKRALFYKHVDNDAIDEVGCATWSTATGAADESVLQYGDVSGVIVTPDSRHLEPVEVFRGIPYASPPVGSLRFMPPVTGALWSGVKMADKFGPVCPQRLPDISNETAALRRMPRGRLEHLRRLLPYLTNQSEDCLYLNIYAPAQGT
ncbi:Neuroligin 3 [Carabus blaptoides fortunei]